MEARWWCAPIIAGIWHECGAAHAAKQIAKLAAASAALGEEQLEQCV
jgi:hypothetical protein